MFAFLEATDVLVWGSHWCLGFGKPLIFGLPTIAGSTQGPERETSG